MTGRASAITATTTTALALAASASLLLGVVPGLVGTATAAAPRNYGCGSPDTAASFDQDEDIELVPVDCAVGLPGATVSGRASAGLVRVIQTAAGEVTLTRASIGFGAVRAGDRFGASVARADLDGNGYSDLVIGAPGAAGTGRFYVVYGAVAGLGTGRHSIELGTNSSAGDALGSSLATFTTPATDSTPVRLARKVDVWVGAPGAHVGERHGAGAVRHWTFTYTFLPLDGSYASGDPVIAAHARVTQASPGVPGSAHAGEGFGTALLGGSCGVIVGTPKDKVGDHARAGSITTVPLDPKAVRRTWTQDSKGVAGSAETGDRFGSALAFHDGGVAVGAPRENVGSVKDAGAVTVIRASSCLPHRGKVTSTVYRQGLRGAAHVGKAENGDRFGTSVASVTYKRPAALYIGAPGENVGSAKDAGAVAAFGVSPRGCPGGEHECGYSLGRSGEALAGSKFGTTLRVVRDGDDFASSSSVVVGAPGYGNGTGRMYAPSWYDLSWIHAGPGSRLGSVPFA